MWVGSRFSFPFHFLRILFTVNSAKAVPYLPAYPAANMDMRFTLNNFQFLCFPLPAIQFCPISTIASKYCNPHKSDHYRDCYEINIEASERKSSGARTFFPPITNDGDSRAAKTSIHSTHLPVSGDNNNARHDLITARQTNGMFISDWMHNFHQVIKQENRSSLTQIRRLGASGCGPLDAAAATL